MKSLILAFLLLIVACSPTTVKEKPLSSDLYIYNWEDYFGETTIEDFEREFGVKIHLDTYEDEEVLFSVLQSDPTKYDIVFPSDDTVRRLVELNLLTPYDPQNIPNLKNIDEKYNNLPNDPDGKYGIPYAWGTTGILYNTKHIQGNPNSWDILFDESYSGKVANLDNANVVIGYTLKLLGHSINTEVPGELNSAKETLLEQKKISQGFFDTLTLRKKVLDGELWAAPVYNGDAIMALSENSDLAFFVPNEGSDQFFDMMAIPIGSKNKYTAEVFINFILRPKVHAAITNYTAYANPNKEAIQFIDPALLNDPVVYPPKNVLEKLESWDVRQSDATINAIWAELRAE